MKVKAYAKINLALDVIGKREDGYHELEMIMAPITLHDLIYINTIAIRNTILAISITYRPRSPIIFYNLIYLIIGNKVMC